MLASQEHHENRTIPWHLELVASALSVTIPSDCHLYRDQPLTVQSLRGSLALVKTYEDDSHLIRTLMRCKRCAQLYFHEFYEVVDWSGGNDAQYSSWIPIDDEQGADHLNDLSPLGLLAYTSIHIDFPMSAQEPSGPYWRVREASA